MFGRRKKDEYREKALREMHKFATCIEWRDLKLFGVLFKYQFDEQYSNNMPPIVAAISVGGPFFATCVQMMESGDRNYLVIYSRYAPFHGACAYHILKNHDFLIDEYREQVFNALERTKSLYIDVEGETSLFDSIMGCVAYSNATGEDQVIIDSEPEHPAIGSVKQTDDAKPTYEPTKTTSLHDIEASREVPSDSEQIDTYQYDKARKVIEYNEEAGRYWNEVQILPESYQNRFLQALSDDPLTDLEALAKRLQEENQKELRPYEDDEANELLGRCRAISETAASEFMEVYKLLGEKADLNYAFAKIEAKFTTPESLEADAKRMRIDQQKAERAAEVAASLAEYHRKNGPAPF